MADSERNNRRRRFLVKATTVIGGAGLATASLPFILSMWPSARTLAAAAPVNVDLSKLEVSQMLTVSWRQRPVMILRRSQRQLDTLASLDAQLKDPNSDSAQQLPIYRNEHRSIKPEYFVAVAICPHLGCVPNYRPQVAPTDLGPAWKGGFYCACHGSRYDLAGRVMNGSPAPLNLPVPPHFFVSDTLLRIGELEDGSERNWHPSIW